MELERELKFSVMLSSLGQWFLARSRNTKRVISINVDLIAIIFSLWLAFSLRLGEFYQPPLSQLWIFFLAPVIAIPVFIRFGLYRAIIRYIGMDALWTIGKAVVLFTLIFAVVVLSADEIAGRVPRTVYGINAVIIMLFVGGSRMMARWLFNQSNQQHWSTLSSTRYVPPVLIYGAGRAGAQLAALLKMSNQMRPVAFIDDNATLHQQHINGLTVYSFEQLIGLIEKFHVRDVLLAMPSVSRRRRSEILLVVVGIQVEAWW